MGRISINETIEARCGAASLDVKVLRCGCGGCKCGVDCNTPVVFDYGTVAYTSKSWWSRFLYFITRLLNKNNKFWRA